MSSTSAFKSKQSINSSSNNKAINNNVVINMRVTANSIQGHRKYMEDCYKIRFQRDSACANKSVLPNDDANSGQSDILFSYFGIFDGHGGKEASQFCKDKLYWSIIESDDFWSDSDDKILSAIRNGFVKCHMNMWKELPNWPKTASGLPSTSGSTATVLFIKKSKAYVGHVGDSGLVIGYTRPSVTVSGSNMNSFQQQWFGKKLTRDHKPEDPIELKRIQNSGGSVMSKSGVNRVVWNRPILNNNISNQNTIRKTNTTPYELNYLKNQENVPTERVPFLAVARSLGDLWSYDCQHNEFIVSPVPDVFCFDLDPSVHKCLILATDGLWNVLKSSECVDLVRQTDKETEQLIKSKSNNQQAQPFVNPSQRLVNTALQRCCEKMIRADNTTCITIMLDQPPDYNSILNSTNISKSKTISDFNNLNHEKSMLSCKFNTSDIDEDDDCEFDDDYEDEFDHSHVKRRKRDKSRNKTFANEDKSEAYSEFNTPLSNDKRSRSLVSLRRRHWSASSNRSTSVSNTTHMLNPLTNGKYINSENRKRRHAAAQALNNMNNEEDDDEEMNKSDSSDSVYSNIKTGRKRRIFHNNTNEANQNELSRSTVFARARSSTRKAANLNSSSLSSFMGINKLSRNLRKSFNDIYTLSKGNGQACNPDDDVKENLNTKKTIEKDDQKEPGQSTSSKYAKRLKRLKNRLIQTKNNFLSKKSKIFSNGPSQTPTTLNKRRSLSSPQLNKIKLNDDDEDDPNNNSQNLKNDNNNNNQSFVNNMKSKFNYLKRNRSSTSNSQMFQQKATIPTSISEHQINKKLKTGL